MKKISLLLAASAIFAGASYAEDITSEVVKKEALTVKYGETINVIGSDAKLIFDPSIPSGWSGGVQYALDIKSGATVNVLNGGHIDMNSNTKDFKVIKVDGVFNVESGTVSTNKITLGTSSKFILSQANAISPSSLPKAYLTLAGKNMSVEMNASQAFILDIRQTASANLSIASSAVLTVASWYVHENIADTAAPTAVVLNDFVSNSIFLADSAITAYDISDDGVLSVSYTQGTQVKRQNFSFLDKNGDIIAMKLVDGVGGKYLSTAIPEPAEWAAVFGALALGFAVCRRRR